MKKVKEARKESSQVRMLLLFDLGKEMGKDKIKGGNKYDKSLAWKIYKSFAVTYPQMSWNKNWRLKHLLYMSNVDAEKMSRIWISTELNSVEGENIQQNQNPPLEA